jgi:hypothetical protein
LRQAAGDAAMLRSVRGQAGQGGHSREGEPPDGFGAFPPPPVTPLRPGLHLVRSL